MFAWRARNETQPNISVTNINKTGLPEDIWNIVFNDIPSLQQLKKISLGSRFFQSRLCEASNSNFWSKRLEHFFPDIYAKLISNEYTEYFTATNHPIDWYEEYVAAFLPLAEFSDDYLEMYFTRRRCRPNEIRKLLTASTNGISQLLKPFFIDDNNQEYVWDYLRSPAHIHTRQQIYDMIFAKLSAYLKKADGSWDFTIITFVDSIDINIKGINNKLPEYSQLLALMQFIFEPFKCRLAIYNMPTIIAYKKN